MRRGEMGNRKVLGKGSQRLGFRWRIAARWRCLCYRSVSRGSHGSSCCVRSSTASSWRRTLRTQWLQAWNQSPGPAAMSLSVSYALADFGIRRVPGHIGSVIWSEPRLHFGLRVPIGIVYLHVSRQLDGEPALLTYCVIRPTCGDSSSRRVEKRRTVTRST